MRTTSLVKAKARLSDIVEQAASSGRATIISRRGKPAAAVVPVDVALRAMGKGVPRARMTPAEIDAMLDGLAQSGDQSGKALKDLYDGRSRLDGSGSEGA